MGGFLEEQLKNNHKSIEELHNKVDMVDWSDLTEKEKNRYFYNNGKLDGIEMVNNELRKHITTTNKIGNK